jgi:tRNA A-37 threonylcarbamoyl transferase component Bud32
MTTELAAGAVVAGFRVESLVGHGAMAKVYRARDEAHDRVVALKILDDALARDERFRQRFLRESQLAASLADPHIVRTLGSGEEDGHLYLAMELIDGSDLRQLLREDGRLEPERTIGLVEQVASALDTAHAAGLIHRDVKPGNILVGSDAEGEHAYVCDFGLARHASSASSLTGDRGFVGTIDYVPPEQIEGGQVDARADVYSLGCMLYECLAGVRPFDRDSELSVVFAHLNEPPPRLTDVRPELPAAFDEVFATALAKAPDDRYSSCGELAAAARAALRGEVLARRKPRRRLLVGSLAVVLVAAAAVAAGLLLTGGSKAAPVTITPTSIGGARLGDTDVTLQRLWGNQYRKLTLDYPPNYSLLTYSSRALSTYFVGTSTRTVEITTANSGDRTAEGIGPCSSLSDLKRVYGSRLKNNPHMVGLGKDKGLVFGYIVGKHMLFIMGPNASPNTVETVALYANDRSNSLASAGFLASGDGPCKTGTPNAVTRPVGSNPVVATPALTQTFASTRFTPHVSVHAPAGWTLDTDTASEFSLKAPRESTTIAFRLDPYASTPGGAPMTSVSRTANGLSAWLHSIAALHAAAGQGSRLGRPVLTVQSVDIGSSSRSRPYLTFRNPGRTTTFATGRVLTRLYLTSIRVGTLVHTLAVAVRSPSRKEFEASLPAADAIVKSLSVSAVPVQEITALSTQCSQAFGFTCLGEVPAGTHTTRSFRPTLTYTIPVGWTNFNDYKGNFGLVPPGGDWKAVDQGKTDYLGVFQRFAPTATRCGDAAAPVRSAAAYVRWLVRNPGLSVTGPKPVTVGGLSGFVVDLRIRKGWTKTCPWSQGAPAVQLIHGVVPTAPRMIHGMLPPPFVMRLYLLDYKHATLGVEIDAVRGTRLDTYSKFVKTFRFAKP